MKYMNTALWPILWYIIARLLLHLLIANYKWPIQIVRMQNCLWKWKLLIGQQGWIQASDWLRQSSPLKDRLWGMTLIVALFPGNCNPRPYLFSFISLLLHQDHHHLVLTMIRTLCARFLWSFGCDHHPNIDCHDTHDDCHDTHDEYHDTRDNCHDTHDRCHDTHDLLFWLIKDIIRFKSFIHCGYTLEDAWQDFRLSVFNCFQCLRCLA